MNVLITNVLIILFMTICIILIFNIMQMNLYMQILSYFSDIQYIYSVKTNKRYTMNILNFMWRFPDEDSCIAYLKEQREQSGVVCRHCGGLEHRWDANKLCFECKHCHSRQSLRSGTVMEHSKLPFSVTGDSRHVPL